MGNLKDFATGVVVTPPSPATSGTSVTLQTGEGARMPATPFYAVAHPPSQMPTLDVAEKIQVTNVTSDTLTIVRAQGGTTAQTITAGWRISNTLFKADIPATSDDLTDGTTYKQYPATDKTKLAGISSGANVTATALAPAIDGATSKATPVDADEIPIADSAASFGLKKLTWANLKATLKTYFDTIYQALNSNLTAIAGLTSANNKIPYFTGSGTAALLTRDTDTALTANTHSNIATQAAVKSYVDTLGKNKQADTTNGTWTRPLIQSGIGRVVSGGGATYQNEDVTFPVAFKTGTVPTVVISAAGYRPAGSGYDPTAVTDFTWSKFSASAIKPTATTFKAYLTRFDGTGMSDDYYYQWIAIGESQ